MTERQDIEAGAQAPAFLLSLGAIFCFPQHPANSTGYYAILFKDCAA
jgi:hypothetical protein